jgi:ribonuclease D
MTKNRSGASSSHSDFVIPSSLDIRHSSFCAGLIANARDLATLLAQIEAYDRVALDTEADSLHCYREKLCLLQISLSGPESFRDTDSSRGEPGPDYVVDPLADVDFAPLSALLEKKEVVLHGSDFDLRLLRRAFDFRPGRIFDTVIAARLLGIQEFSLAAMVKRNFGVELTKSSQKANWAQRPLPQRMVEYAINDTHYLLPLAEKLEGELKKVGRFDWFQQSCERAVEQAAVDRTRDADEIWRISGAGALRGRASAVLRELWQWREKEAEAADRPPFHILQNRELLNSAESFAGGQIADYRHFSGRRRQGFREAAERGLQLAEADWPVLRRRFGTRPSLEIVRRMEELKQRRDQSAAELGLEPAFVAPRTTLESIAADKSRAASLLVPWQRQLLGLEA